MANEYWLSDQAWASIEPLMPQNQPGARRVDDRRVISGIIHVLQSGCRWKDCPAVYGPPTTIYNRFNRWSRKRLWQKIFETLVAGADLPDDLSIDSRAYRSASGLKGGRKLRPSGARVAAEQPKSMHWHHPDGSGAGLSAFCQGIAGPASGWQRRATTGCRRSRLDGQLLAQLRIEVAGGKAKRLHRRPSRYRPQNLGILAACNL